MSSFISICGFTNTKGLFIYLFFRLIHDLSPDTDDSSSDDEESLAVQRETFILSCLAQSTINNNSINHVSQTTCHASCGASRVRTESISDTYAKLEWKQHHLEQINNQINEQHLYKMLEQPCQNINQINNNFLQVSTPVLLNLRCCQIGCQIYLS